MVSLVAGELVLLVEVWDLRGEGEVVGLDTWNGGSGQWAFGAPRGSGVVKGEV
jgi:hypothetical protein